MIMKSALCMKRAQSKIFDCSVFMKQEADMRKILKLFIMEKIEIELINKIIMFIDKYKAI